jgi:hypothetical protein
LTLNDPQLSQIVDKTRKMTMENPLKSLLDNKLTAFSGVIVTKFINSLSADYLFSTGDSFYSIYTHGLLYPLDALFILFGLVFVFAKDKRKFYFLLLLAFLALLPQVFHTASTDNFTPHMALIFPVLIIFIACGIVNVSEIFKGRITLILISLLYAFSLINFLNIYFYQYPLREPLDFRLRLLSKYVQLAGKTEKITIFNPRSADTFMKYIFYSDVINKNTVDTISNSFKNHNYVLGNAVFTDCNTADLSKNVSIIDYSCGDFGKDVKHVSIADLSDGFGTFRIYNDTLCRGIGLKPFPTDIKISDFSIEKMSRENFCKTYITSY